MIQGDIETQIALFQLSDQSAIPLLGDGNDKKRIFFENELTLKTHSCTPSWAKVTKFYTVSFQLKVYDLREFGQNLWYVFFLIHPNGLTIQKLQFNWRGMQLLQVVWDNLR